MSKISKVPPTKTFARSFVSDRKGVTAIEYGLIAGIVAIAIITTLGLLSGNLVTLFTTILNAVGAA